MKEILIKLATTAGEILIKHFRKGVSVKFKTRNNPVTLADKESEETIKNMITKKFLADKFICEESVNSVRQFEPNTRYWVIDPLDGTVNYFHGVPIFSVSIGVVEKKKVVGGIVYSQLSKEMFYALKGKGSYKNGKRIYVSKITSINDALLVTGFPYSTFTSDPKQILALFNAFTLTAQGMRRFGSAAVDLCYIADGVLDGFWETGLNSWDVAAGSIIVTEAGGKMTDYSNKDGYMFNGQMIASNKLIHSQMLEVVASVLKPK